MTNYCEGCRSHTHETGDEIPCCSHVSFNQNSECPCGTCIVKVMCLNGCQLFFDFRTRCENFDRAFISERVWKGYD